VTEPLRDDSVLGVNDRADEAPSDDEPGDGSHASTGPGLPPPSAIESLVSALLEAGPDVAEHVVRAAQELLLAAQCIVDAADQAVQEQLDVRDLRAEAKGPDATTDTETNARVLPLDFGE
jgi:hypothetical protein